MLGVQAKANAARAHLRAQRPNASSADTHFNRRRAALAARFRLLAPMKS